MKVERGRLFVENDAPDWWKPGEYVQCIRNGTNVGSVIIMHLEKFKPGASRITDGLSILINSKILITGKYVSEKHDGESIVLFLQRPDHTEERSAEARAKAEAYTSEIGVKLETITEKEAFLKKVIWECYRGEIPARTLTAVANAIEYLIDNHDLINRSYLTGDGSDIDYKQELEKLIRNSSTSDSTKLNAIRDLIKRGEAKGEDKSEQRVRRKVLIEDDDGD